MPYITFLFYLSVTVSFSTYIHGITQDSIEALSNEAKLYGILKPLRSNFSNEIGEH